MIKRKLISLGLSITLLSNITSSLFTINSSATNIEVVDEIINSEVINNEGKISKAFVKQFVPTLSKSVSYLEEVIKVSDGIVVAGWQSGVDSTLTKYDFNGNQLWQKVYDYNGESNTFRTVAQTKDGGYIAVGDTSAWSLDNMDATDDIIMVKYNSSGTQQWAKKWGGNDEDSIGKVIATSDGGFICVGRTDSTNISGVTNKGGSDAIIVKFNSSGTQQWVRSTGGSDYDCYTSIVQGTDGSYYTTLYTESLDNSSIDAYLDGVVVKYNSSGTLQTYYKDGNVTSLGNLKQTSDGGFIATGSYQFNDKSEYLVKYNSSFTRQWQSEAFGGNSYDSFGDVTEVSDGYVVSGSTYSNDIEGFPNKASGDAFLIKYDKSGNLLFGNTSGATSGEVEIRSHISIDDNAHIGVGYGTFKKFEVQDVQLDSTPPTISHTLNPSTWTKGNVTINITATDDSGISNITLPNGNIVSSSSTSYTVSANGTYGFKSTDNNGNIGTHIIQVANIDKVAPVINYELTSSPIKDKVDVVLNVSDALSGIKVITFPNGTTSTTSVSGLTYTITKNGKYTFKATDNAGNEKSITIEITEIDSTKPELSYTITPNTLTTGNVTINVTATDDGGISQITLPDGTTSTTSPVSFVVTQNGSYTFTATDNSGNSNSITVEITNIDDNAPPELKHTLSPSTWTNGDVTINLTATDKDLKAITLPNGNVVNSSPVSYKVSNNGTYIFMATDNKGNTSNIAVKVTNIDKKIPTTNNIHNTEWTNEDVKVTIEGLD